MRRLLYSRSSEKSSLTVVPGQLMLGIEAEVIEACKIIDGQKIASFTKSKAEKKKLHAINGY
jgi:transposase